jgi:hypothetical protein
MTTFPRSLAISLTRLVGLHRLRMVALVEAVNGLAAALLGPAVVDPDSGVRISPVKTPSIPMCGAS